MDKPIPAPACPTAYVGAEASYVWAAAWDAGVQAALTAAQQQGQAVDRDRTLTAARFRAACYALQEAVEGPTGAIWRSEVGERLKDRPEWVAFYNLVSDMRERGGPDPYAQSTQQGGGGGSHSECSRVVRRKRSRGHDGVACRLGCVPRRIPAHRTPERARGAAKRHPRCAQPCPR